MELFCRLRPRFGRWVTCLYHNTFSQQSIDKQNTRWYPKFFRQHTTSLSWNHNISCKGISSWIKQLHNFWICVTTDEIMTHLGLYACKWSFRWNMRRLHRHLASISPRCNNFLCSCSHQGKFCKHFAVKLSAYYNLNKFVFLLRNFGHFDNMWWMNFFCIRNANMNCWMSTFHCAMFLPGSYNNLWRKTQNLVNKEFTHLVNAGGNYSI